MNFYIVFLAAVGLATALVSQDIYIINEETLIGLTFITFMFLVYDIASDAIRSELDDRASKISKEFETYFLLREQAIELLISYYKKQLTIAGQIEKIVDQGHSLIIRTFMTKKAKLANTIIAQQKAKLNYILNRETALVQDLQLKITDSFSASIYQSFKEGTDLDIIQLKQEALDDSIKLIKAHLENA